MTIALFGYYKYGNFGDDLMAAMVGRELRRRALPFRVYGLTESIARVLDVDRAASLDELLRGAKAVVYGGGGAFLPPEPDSSVRRAYDRDIAGLTALCAERRIPIMMVSVGGAGQPPSQLSEARRQLLRQARFISFRNPEDARMAEEMSGEHRIHADLVWDAATTFARGRPAPSPNATIAVDRSMLYSRKHRLVVKALIALCKVRRTPYSFRLYDQRHESAGDPEQDVIRYSGVRSFLDRIAEASLVLTSRLHLGMVAMSCGIPTVQLAPLPKAKIVFHRLGLGDLVASDVPSLLKVFDRILGREGLSSLGDALTQQRVESLKQSSRRHFDDLFARLPMLMA